MNMNPPQGRCFQGVVYCACNPDWAAAPSAEPGASLAGGRFNRPGRGALYAALSPVTALREASALGRPMAPLTLRPYAVDCAAVFDACDGLALAREGIDLAALECPDWELRMRQGVPVPSQDLAERLIARGYGALIVPSFARGAGQGERNLVFWDWQSASAHELRPLAGANQLPQSLGPWV